MWNLIALTLVVFASFALILLCKRWEDGPKPFVKRQDGKYDLTEREQKILEGAKKHGKDR